MFSSNKNIDAIERIIAEVKQYVDLQKEYVRLDLVSKMTILLSALILNVILFLISMIVILFIAIAGGALLGQWLNNTALGYGFIALLLVLAAVLIYTKRKKWITRPVTRFLVELFIDKK